MSALDPQAIENKKLSLDQAGQAKRGSLAQQTLNSYNVAPIPEYEADAIRKNRKIEEAIARNRARSEGALVSDWDLHTAAGIIGQRFSDMAIWGNRLTQEVVQAPSAVMELDYNSRIPDRAEDIHRRETDYQQKLAGFQKAERDIAAAQIMGRITPEEYDSSLRELNAQWDTLQRPSEEELAFLNDKGSPVFGSQSFADKIQSRDKWRERNSAVRDYFQNNGVEDLRNSLQMERADAALSPVASEFKGKFEETQDLWKGGNRVDAFVKGATELVPLVVEGIQTLGDHPGAVSSYVTENVPDVALGVYRRVIPFVLSSLYAGDAFSQSQEDFREREGREPSKEELTKMAMWHISMAGSEFAGTDTLAKGVRKAFKGKPDADIKATSGTKTTPGQGGGMVLGTAASTGKGLATEWATETYQTAVETGLGSLTSPDIEETFKGGVIGGVVGGVISGGVRSAAETGKAVAKAAETVRETQQKRAAASAEVEERQRPQREAFDTAVETGDVTDLTDTSKPETYAPGRAVEALVKRAQEADLTPEEKEATAVQAREIISDMKTRARSEETKLTNIREKAELKEGETFTSLEATLKKRLKDMPKDDPNRDAIEEMLTDLTESVKIEQHVARQIQLAEQAESLLTADMRPDNAEVESLVSRAVSTESTPESAAATTRLLTLAMTDPDAVPLDTLESLVSSESTNISPEQRSTFTALRDAQQAREKLKTSSDVNKEVLYGGPGFKGLNEYQANMAAAVRTNDVASLEQEIEQLKALQTSHANKLKRLKTAVQAIAKNPNLPPKAKGDALYLVKGNTPGSWGIQKNKPKGWKPGPDTGRTLHMSQPGLRHAEKLLEYVDQEVDAINKTLASMNKAKEMRFDQTVTERPEGASAPVQTPDLTEVPLSAYEQDAVGDANLGENNAAPETQQEATPVAEQPEATPDQQETKTEPTDPPVVEPTVEERETPPDDTQTYLPPTDTTQDVTDVDAALREAMTESVSEDMTEEGAREVESGIDPAFTKPENKIKGHLPAAEYRTKNLLAGFISQVMDTNRPLVAMKNFFSSLLKDPTLVDFFRNDNGKPMTDRQKAFLSTAQRVVKSWGPKISANLDISEEPKVNRETGKLNSDPKLSRHRDLLRYFKDTDVFPDGIPENWRAAIGMAAFTWATEQAQGNGWNTLGDIRRSLGKDKTDVLTDDDIESLREGTFRHLAALDLGRRAAEMLNTKVSPDAPAGIRTQLEASLGNQALAILIREEWVEEFLVPANINESDMDSEGDAHSEEPSDAPTSKSKVKQPSPFIRVIRDELRKPVNPVLKSAAEERKGTRNVLENIFGMDKRVIGPSLVPGDYEQERIRNSSSGIPPKAAAILKEKVATRAHGLNTQMMRILDGFHPEMVNMLFGAVDMDTTYVHAEEALAQEARNDEVARDLDHLRELRDELNEYGEGPETPFYLPPVMYKQQRTGQAPNTINTQSSKNHRAFVFMEDWATDIDPNNSTDVALFKLAIAQGLGVKVDKQDLQESLDALEKKLEDPIFSEALAAIYDSKDTEGELTISQQEAIFGAVVAAKTDNRAHTLLALIELDRFYTAQAQGKPFTTRMYFESDGLTNGPAFAHILAGIIDAALGEKVGFYTEGSKYSNFIQWNADPANNDLYESLMAEALPEVRQAAMGKNPSFKAVEAFLGNLVDGKSVKSPGRNLAKPAVTPTAFGASVQKTLNNTADVFVESFHKKLMEVANDTENFDSDQARVDEINRLIGVWNKDILKDPKAIKPVRNPREAMTNTSMTPDQKDRARLTFQDTLGGPIKAAMNTQFEEFFEARKTLNDAANTMFEVYDELYQRMKKALIEHRIKEGKLYVSDKGKAQVALSESDENIIRTRLEKVLPSINTPMSRESGGFKAGLELFKSKRRLSTETAFTTQTNFDTPLAPKRPGLSSKGIYTRGTENYLGSPGVATGVLVTHSFDSWVGMSTYDEHSLLNVHDGFGAGLRDVLASTQALNKNTFYGLANYSFPMELLATWDRMLANMEKDESLGVTPARLANLRNQRNKFAEFAYQAEETKLNYLATVTTVQQYVVPGGEFKVEAADKRMVEANLKKLHEKREKEGIFRSRQASNQQYKKYQEDLPHATSNPWGAVGTPRTPSNGNLMEALRRGTKDGTENLKGDKLNTFVRYLGKQIRDMDTSTPVKQFQLGLWRQIMKDLGDDLGGLEIRLITPDTPLDTKGMQHDRGWYALHDNVISIKSNAFVHSAVTPELLMHELSHAALADRITKEMDKPEEERSEAVKELISLVNAAREYVDAMEKDESPEGRRAAKGIKSFHVALGGKRDGQWSTDMNRAVNELVAWGMTNRAFQTQVLDKVEFRSSNRGLLDTVKSGMKTFVDGLLGILFGRFTPAQETGMTALVINTGLLFGQEADPNASQRKKVFRQESTDIETMTTAQVYSALAAGSHTQLSPEYDAHLQEVLQEVVGAVYGPYGSIPAFAQAEATVKPEDTLLNAIQSGEMPFASKALGYVKLTNQEAFVLESAQVTLKEAINRSQVTREEVRRIWRQARTQLKPETFHQGDWSQASPEEKTRAEEIHEFIFSVEQDADGVSDYLSQFAAMGLAYQPLRDALKTLQAPAAGPAPVTLWQKLKAAFNRAMRFLAETIARIQPGQTPDAQLMSMTKNLARLEAKHKAALQARRDASETYVDRASESMKDLGNKGIKAVADSRIVAWANQYQETPVDDKTAAEKVVGMPGRAARTAIRAVGTAAKVASGQSLNDVLDGAADTRNRLFQGRLGAIAEAVNEIRGATDNNKQFHVLAWAANKHEQERKHIKDGHAALVRKQFQPMTKQESADTTRTVLRTDLVSLLAGRSVAQLASFLKDPSARQAEIKKLEDQLTNADTKDDYLVQAKGLGYVMATGIHAVRDQGENAHVIARWDGNERRNITESEAKKAEKVLDQLISLYAIEYLPQGIRNSASQVFDREVSRQDGGNGALFILKLHEQLKNEALVGNFEGNPVLMRKGYVREIYNPHISLVFETEEKGRIYEQAGYGKGIPLWKDHADPNKEQRHLYAIRGMGMDSRVTGIFSDTGMDARGSSVKQLKGRAAIVQMIANNAKAKRKIDGKLFDPRKSARYARPVRNGNGEIVDYAYEMADTHKDDLLERDNRLDQVIGNMAGNSFDKAHTTELNLQAVEAFKQQYQRDLGLETEAYIEFGPNSRDPEIRERYALLPEATKQTIRDVWGEDRMMVKNELYNLAFGYKKLSIRGVLPKEGEDIGAAREILVKTMVWALNLFPKGEVENLSDEEAVRLLRAHVRLKKGGDIWVELVRMFKDNVVIKNFFTLATNSVSNTWVLWLNGVPTQNIVRDSVIGFKAAMTYRKDQRRLLELQRLVDIGMVPNLADAMLEIAEIQDAMKRNPIAPLAEAGLMQTIVEDVEIDQDPYSYKSRLMEGMDRATHMIPEKVKQGARVAVVAQGTPFYNVLAEGTSLSDFVSRYVLYKHLTEGRRNPLSSADALLRVSEEFVNYDIPTHRYLQYLNDTGFVPFTKYYLRSQKVLFRLMHEEPARMLAMSMMANLFPSLPTFLDSGIWNRLDHPVSAGAFEYPGTVGEIVTVKAVSNVLDL